MITYISNQRGYGLVTCAKIIENHNAGIDIISEVGVGSAFVVSFRSMQPTVVQT